MTTRYFGDVVTFWAQFVDGNGNASDATGSPAYRVYEEITDSPIATGSMSIQDDAGTTGFYRGQITITSGAGFEVDKSYCVRTSALVATLNQAGILERFVVRAAIAAPLAGGVSALGRVG